MGLVTVEDVSESDLPGYDPSRDDPDLVVDGEDTEELADTGFSPPDFEPKSLHEETTEEEVLAGESLDQRLSEEVPDVGSGADGGADRSQVDEGDDADVPDEFADLSDSVDGDDELPDRRAGRLVASQDAVDTEPGNDLLADDAGFAGYAASAEEAAVHVVDDDQS